MDASTWTLALGLSLVTLVAGAAVGALGMRRWSHSRLAELATALDQARQALTLATVDAEAAKQRAYEAEIDRAAVVGQRDAALDRARAADEAAHRAGALTAALGPLSERLELIGRAVGEMDRDRSTTAGRLTEQLRTVHDLAEGLRAQTSSLAGALRSSNARGTWGEVQLRRIVEAAGMLARVDFDVQAHMTGPDGTAIRPDMVVRLPDGRAVVVDAKAPLALPGDAATGADADLLAGEQARKLRGHITALSQKRYWAGLPSSPEFVVCFLPAESILASALAADPSLIEDAMAIKVVPATPTTLLVLLRTVAMTWREQAVHENAQAVLELGREMYQRLGKTAEHADRVGRALDRAVGDYNRFVGSFEARLLVTARKMSDLGLDGEVAVPRLVESGPRGFTTPELTAAEPEVDEFELLVEVTDPSRTPGPAVPGRTAWPA